MLTIPQVREPQTAAALAKRGKDYAPVLSQIIEKDNERKKLVNILNSLQANSSGLADKIHTELQASSAFRSDDPAVIETKKQAGILKTEVANVKSLIRTIEAEIQELLCQLPNAPLEEVPPGLTPYDNVIVKEVNTAPPAGHIVLPHYEIAQKYDLIDFDAGSKLTGSGFPVYKGLCALLQRKLIHYFLGRNIAAGYKEVIPPTLVNASTAFGTGQLPDKDGQMYVTMAEGFYLIPTAEVPVTNLYADTIFKEADLPVKLTAYTQCFRREAGSYGKDVRGLNRLHEFSKVEIVQFTTPGNSLSALEGMVAHVESLLVALKLPYRILKLCGGDMGNASALTYDFEVYSTGQGRWLEVSSTSSFITYQSNRMNTKYKDGHGKKHLVHTLNGSALALPRIMAALLEYHYNGKEDFINSIFDLIKD